ncbi:hypothetical protein HRUBRA_02391 [Pseudohaliea rubra DSM 19751]|uniref:DUF3108 domain-containing protein n=1 Tax=Pseudohaliea rubra DSM 19751 TaxID=1265313 RepID=A0A095VPI8_9GAMM|nr:hypothetical protein HRUBRA_02391 [Pseudohaliea rubra DSM 19751]
MALCLLATTGPAGNVLAADADELLAPFSAEYRVRFSALPFSARATRSLAREGEGWLFRSVIDARLLSLRQEAVLASDPVLRALEYRYRQGGLARRRERVVTFDRDAGLVRRSGDKEREHPLIEPAWDPLGWQLALRRDLVRDHPALAARYEYRVSDGGDYENYSFTPGLRETVTVPAGTFEALRLERAPVPEGEEATRLWLDPGQDYLLLRMELVDEDGRELTVTLETPPDPAAAEKP